MRTKREVLETTSYPKLVNAVIRRIGIDSVEDVNNNGIDGGFNGFIYYTDTIAFFNSHRKDILSMAEEDAKEFGIGLLEMIRNFRCLGTSYSIDEIAQALYQGKGESVAVVKNAMAWYAAEQVCRMFEN